MPQAIPIIIGIAGLGLAAYGTVTQMNAASDMSDAQKRADELRARQMELEAERKKKETIRQAQVARATALATANAQGARESSGLFGGYGQISGDATQDITGVNNNLVLGRGIFAANASYADAQSQYYMGGGLSSLGGQMVSSMGAVGRLSGGFGGGSSYSQGYGPQVYNQSLYGNYGIG